MMDWDKLRIFHMVAEAGSFTHAGESLQLSQSAVSRHISSFEESLGVTLFHRHARGLILTEQGELLHKSSREIFMRLSMIEGQLSDSKDISDGEMSITVAEFIGSHFLSPHLREFHETNPHIRLNMLMDDRVLNLGMREADAAIRLYKPEQADLIQRHIATVNFVICASSEYLSNHNAPKKITDLKNHTLITYPEHVLTPYANPNWMLDAAELSIRTHKSLITVNSVSAIYQAVKHGAGIACLPKFMVTQHKNIQILLPNAKPPSVDMFYVYAEERRNSKRIGLVRDFIMDKIKETEF
jgi:DNA-binding transcriptional LysR family regulator